jgi:predicted transcriptional regulator of viral defense system
MIKTAENLISEFGSSYKEPYHHLAYLERSKQIFQIKRGLYETDRTTDPLVLAGAIVSPSYISFETALSYYGIIPERSLSCLSATFRIRKNKIFHNVFGTFAYQDIPEKAYPLATRYLESNGRRFEIATPEKALCDTLSKQKGMTSIEELKDWFFVFMRMDSDSLLALDSRVIEGLAPLYRKKNVYLFRDYLKGAKKS